jgi:hypothetical protein
MSQSMMSMIEQVYQANVKIGKLQKLYTKTITKKKDSLLDVL